MFEGGSTRSFIICGFDLCGFTRYIPYFCTINMTREIWH